MPADETEIRRHPLVRALLDWTEGYVMVLDEDRRVMATSDRLPDPVRRSDPEDLLGKRPGEVLKCAHARPDGCTSGIACRFCGALEAFERARTEGTARTAYKLVTDTPEGKTSYKFDVVGSRFPLEGRDYTALHFRQASEVSRSGRYESVVGERDWPEDLTGFRRVRLLGSGGMGSVYLVKDEQGRFFALKVLNEEILVEKGRIDRFRHELGFSLKLDHPNIVHTYQAGQGEDGVIYMVLEYCPLGSVLRHLKFHGTLPVDLALFWMIGAARGLAYLWEEFGTVHRDIKPDNLLVTADDTVKISDFGIARQVRDDARRTRAGVILGSPEYMSPEQILGRRDLDARSDLYSLGVTFYELLAGYAPFASASPAGAVARHIRDVPPSVQALREDVPSGLSETIGALLRKKRQDRPGTPTELLDTLLSSARALGVDPDAAPRSTKDAGTREMASPDAETRSLGEI